MYIYTLEIRDEETGVNPIYEVHSWEKAEEIIMKTKELMGDKPFHFAVYGNSGNR